MSKQIKLNHDITDDDTYLVIHQTVQEQGFSHHGIESMNDFYNKGIEEIITKVFEIKDTIKNIRDKTDEDRAIDKISYQVEFKNIRLKTPVTAGYHSGREQILMPNMAHKEDRTYRSNLYCDATIRTTAIRHDGSTIERQAEVANHRLVNIPTMVRSCLCNTYNKSAEALRQLQEDPKDPGSYFIKNGKEWVIDNLENTLFNQPRIFNNAWRNEVQRLEFISKPGDSYQNSKQCIIRLMTSGILTVEIVSTNLREFTFPFFFIFRMLGCANDKEMFDHILYRNAGYPEAVANMPHMPDGQQDEDVLFREMFSILDVAMHAQYDDRDTKFSLMQSRGQYDVMEYLVKNILKDKFKDLDMSKDEHVHQAVIKLFKWLDEDFLPHVGIGPSARPGKIRYLGYFINRMMYVKLGILKPTDRDSYNTKRVHTVGISLGKALKTHFSESIVNQIKKQFTRDFNTMSFGSVNLQQTFQIGVNGADFERLLMQSITSASQTTLKVHRTGRQIVNRLSSQLMDRKNTLRVLSTIRTVISPNSDNSKGSERAKEMRMPHPSFQGFICIIQSSDHGEKVGMHKQLCISASISSYSSSEVLKQMLLSDSLIKPLNDIHPYNIRNMSKVFVNGDWIGCTADSTLLIDRYTDLRRSLIIDDKCTIEFGSVMNDVNFWVDYGRPYRPLLIVYNNMRDYLYFGLKEPAPIEKFEQGVALTSEIIDDLRQGKLTLKDLQKMKVIEYITPQEQSRMLVSPNVATLKDARNDPTIQYNHCDVPEAILGIAALTGPLANRNQTTRNTFQTSQVRQTGGYYAYNWVYRVDKDTFLQYQVEQPLVTTRIGNYISPNGSMIMVAMMCYSGYNEEDSAIWNKNTSECLKFNGSWFNYDKTELEKSEKFALPDITKTYGIKSYANYSKLGKDGIIPVGVVVKKGDVVAGKIKRLPKNDAEEKGVEYQDVSMIYKNEFPAIVHNVIMGKDDEATRFVKIAYRSVKNILIGDKFSSRAAQKGVCALTLSQSDMPFNANGIVPDLIMNPHSFPTRMTMGQILEGIISCICTERGIRTDGTIFREFDLDNLITEAKKLGINDLGYERMYCGITGNWVDNLIYFVPNYYQRLQKFVTKSVYAADTCPTDILTRQPLDGKATGGGLRIGEMQRDVMFAAGTARMFAEKFFEDSDDFEMYYCKCGAKAIVNTDINLYECRECGDDAHIFAVHSSWSSKLLFQELNAISCGTRFQLDVPQFFDYVNS